MSRFWKAGMSLTVCSLLFGCGTIQSSPECGHTRSEIAQIRERAAAGDPDSEFQIASFYLDGTCLKQSSKKASRWYQKAATAGHIDSQIVVASSYMRGDGVARDPSLAALWYEKAAIQGSADAQFELAKLYQNGIGVPQSVPTAKQLYAKSASRGHVWAEYRLCQLTPKCSPPSQAAVVLKSLRQRLEREEQERLLAIEARRKKVSDLLGTVVVRVHPFDDEVEITKPYSQRTASTLGLVADSAVRMTYTLFTLGLSAVALDPTIAIRSVNTPQERTRFKGLSPEENKIAKDMVRTIRASFTDLKPERILQEKIVEKGASEFDSAFTQELSSARKEGGKDSATDRPNTSILVTDMVIDLHAQSVWIDRYSLDVAALISVTNIVKRKSLIDTIWYKYTVHNLSLQRLASDLEEVIDSASDGISSQLFAKIHDEAS